MSTDITYTINGKPVAEVTKEEAIQYFWDKRNAYIRECWDGAEEGIRQADCLLSILEGGTIEVSNLPEYGLSDQDLGIEASAVVERDMDFEKCIEYLRSIDEATLRKLCEEASDVFEGILVTLSDDRQEDE